jgi:hypothetical protein
MSRYTSANNLSMLGRTLNSNKSMMMMDQTLGATGDGNTSEASKYARLPNGMIINNDVSELKR